jgi:hypothetical protein
MYILYGFSFLTISFFLKNFIKIFLYQRLFHLYLLKIFNKNPILTLLGILYKNELKHFINIKIFSFVIFVLKNKNSNNNFIIVTNQKYLFCIFILNKS